MRSLASSALATGLLLVIMAAPVTAAAPVHETVVGSFTDPDFCGTGQSVDVTLKGVLNSSDDQTFGHINRVWTNPANGAAVIEAFAGGGKFSVIDDGGGAYTIQLLREGLPVQLRILNGPLLALDAGLVVFYDHFDADGSYLGSDIEVLAGPHPLIDDADLGCNLMIDALGL